MIAKFKEKDSENLIFLTKKQPKFNESILIAIY